MRIKQTGLRSKLDSLFLVPDSEKGFSPIILIAILGLGILIFSGIIFSRVNTAKNIAVSPKPFQLALVTPTPSALQDDEDDSGGDEGDTVDPADLEGPD